MKKLLIMILIFSLFRCCYGMHGIDTIKVLNDKGIKIIEDQSFWTTFENWGKVKFLSCEYEDGLSKLLFYLADEKDNILYAFPDFYGNDWCFYEMKAVSFKDVNKDGLNDIIVIADYMTGIGNEGAVPFPVCGIYFQKGKKFIAVPEVNEEINNAMQNKNIAMVINFTDKKVKEINELLEKKYPRSVNK